MMIANLTCEETAKLLLLSQIPTTVNSINGGKANLSLSRNSTTPPPRSMFIRDILGSVSKPKYYNALVWRDQLVI